MSATVLDPVEVRTDDPDKVAHVVIPKAAVAEAYVNGAPVVALCGHVFVPHRNPENLPRCEPCFDVLNEARAAQGKPPA